MGFELNAMTGHMEWVREAVWPLRLAGRCANGAERDGGARFHAVPMKGPSLCGATPGRTSAGWSAHAGEAVTCPRCLRRMKGGRYFVAPPAVPGAPEGEPC